MNVYLLVAGAIGAIAIIAFSIRYLMLDHLHRFKSEIVEQLNTKHFEQKNQQFQYQVTLQDTLRHTSNELNTAVEKRLNEGLDKTTATITNIAERLAKIDEAQRNITDLSNNVLGLQAILSDKKSRGAFGEIQLNNLISNMLPAKNYQLQYQLSTGVRCDCIVIFPQPTGNIVIDSKFPLENFNRYNDNDVGEADKKKYIQAFNQDVKKHINDIATKYIIPGETSNGAIMFIPAEAIFAEIHSKYPELVTYAQQSHVWLTSPTTLMAILTTASGVLKDQDTRENIHIIQEQLRILAKDFSAFTERMSKLSKHIDMIQNDAKDIDITANKIIKRFNEIDKVEIMEEV